MIRKPSISTSKPESDLAVLLHSMEPLLNDGVYVYSSVPPEADLSMTVIVPETDALAAGLPILFRAAWITLKVHSELQAVGLTAAFSSALGRAGISCNVVAGAYHDHIFIPVDRAEEAMDALRSLQRDQAS
jgi:hypothetical protein